MHELYAEILSYIQGATRYKWVAMAVAWFFCISGWVVVSSLPDHYEASARVHVDTQSMLQPLLRGLTIGSQVKQQLDLLKKEIFSRPNLMKIARATDLDLQAKDNKEMDSIIEDLKKAISLSASKNDFLFTIKAKNSDPALAKRIVQELLALFVEQARGKNREESDSAHRFLDEQVREYETMLQKAELAKEDFKRENYSLLPKQGSNPYSQIQSVSAKLAEAELALEEARNRRDALERQISGEEPTFLGLAGSGVSSSSLDARIQALQQKVDQLTLKYTDGHPEVVAAKRSIAELEKEKEKEKEEASALDDGSIAFDNNVQSNPVFQQMKISHANAAADVASLEARVKSYREQVETMRTRMDQMLKVETEMQNLNRDYSMISKNYQTLLARRESARLSEKVEKTTESVNFRIVDPPTVPSSPSFPNRILFSSLVLPVGLLLGIASALVVTFLRPTFPNTQKLRDVTGLPILGQVSMNWIPEIKQRKWISFLRFCGVGMMLFVVFVGVLLLEINGLNLTKV